MRRSRSVIDKSGLRLNVGIILTNGEGKLFWGRRADKSEAWQFPQGGMMHRENPEQTMYRELREELGLNPNDIEIMAVSQRWLHYYLPKQLRRYHSRPFCISQKQKWFLLRLVSDDSHIRFDLTEKPEFNHWQWVDYWLPATEIVMFKRDVYRKILQEFEPLVIKK